MLFNSFEYLIFLPIVFVLYWLIKPEKFRWQNTLLIIGSYIFYACWDYRFLCLLIFSTSLDYFTGLKIYEASEKGIAGQARNDKPLQKKIWLIVSIVVNLSFLGFFKYYNFFIGSFAELLQGLGFQPHVWTLKIIIPVGISFYTFHGLSYVLDIYHDKIKPTKNIIDYSLFVSFFPLLVAGPIERATHLLPQLKKPRYFDRSTAVDGLKQILWGLFKKVVIADNCATIVDHIFKNSDTMPSISLVLGVFLFAFQLYGDFSGYSDIALGSARLLGIELLRNFAYPYFAVSFSDYWRRNHISLTQWFMDYVYYPLIGSSDKLWYWNLCMIVTFLLSGLWHGADWTFVIWGLYQGIFIVISMNSQKRIKRFEKKHHLKENKPYYFSRILLTFGIVCFGLIFFRADSVSLAFSYISNIFSSSLFSIYIGEYPVGRSGVLRATLLIVVLVVVEWRGRENPYAIVNLGFRKKWARYLMYYILVLAIIVLGGQGQQFLYFQF
jgi:D-alanyl-lipoteichoic acid acyltransferase DltB (MBOAT superfamily)